MRFAVFHWILCTWVLWRFVLPLTIRRGPKIAMAVFTVLCASFSTFTVLFFGGLLSPELPRWAIITGNFFEACLLFMAGLAFVREFAILAVVLAGRMGRLPHRIMQKDRRVALGMAAASAGLAAASVYGGVKVPDVREHAAYIPNLPPALEGFKLVQLSDLHCSALLTAPHTEAVVERVNALEPELVLITGDIVDGVVERRLQDVAPLAKIRAKLGVFGCDGNHEQYGPYEDWEREFAKLGIRMLHNEHALLDVEGPKGRAQLCLAGVCDPMAARFGREMPDAKKAFAGAPAPEAALRILMAHQPKFFDRYKADAPFALQLSGHTHGGQLVLMDRFVGIMNGTYVRGFYRAPEGTLMYVHPGSGLWNGFPLRLGVPSEIAVIRLTGDPSQADPEKPSRVFPAQGAGKV